MSFTPRTIGSSAPCVFFPRVQKSVTFNVVAPNGIMALSVTDQGYGAAGVNSWGMQSQFRIQTLPNIVNFSRAQFTEDIPVQRFTLNSGTIFTVAAFGPPAAAYQVANNTGQPNIAFDTLGSGTFAPGSFVLRGAPADWNYAVSVPRKYKNQAGAYTAQPFFTDSHKYQFVAATQKAQCIDILTNTMNGASQGPWNAAPAYGP